MQGSSSESFSARINSVTTDGESATPYEMHGHSSSDDESATEQDRRSLIGSAHSRPSRRRSHSETSSSNFHSSRRLHNMCSALQALIVLSAAVVLVNNFLSEQWDRSDPVDIDSISAEVSKLRGPTQSKSHKPSASNTEQQRRSFVCITGQLSRLELQNKIATVLEPLRKVGLPPDIALVVDDTISFTTNDQRIDADYHPAYTSLADVVNELRSFEYTVLTDGPYHQPAEVIVPPDYMKYLHQRSSFDYNKTTERAANNVRMMESWSQCYVEMSRDVERMASYDVVVRIREDTGFLSAVDFGRVQQDLRDDPLAMLNNGCRAWYDGIAMNDKFGIVSRESARAYFQLPYHNMYAAPITRDMKNTERFFFFAYTNAGYHVTRSTYIRNVVKLVSSEDGTTMLFHQERKKLAKNCQIAVEDDSVPGACTFRWNKNEGKLKVDDDICWPSHVIESSDKEDKGVDDNDEGGGDGDDDDDGVRN